MTENWLVYYLGEKEIFACTLRGAFEGEAQATAEHLAAENGVPVESVRVTCEVRGCGETYDIDRTGIVRAMGFIRDFCECEYGNISEDIFNNLGEIGLAFTTTEDEQHEIQVDVDLIRLRLVSKVDGIIVAVEDYETMKEVCTMLSGFDYDVAIADAMDAAKKKGVLEIYAT